MFKDRPTAIRAMLVAGVGSTMPMQLASINRGWKPNAIEVVGEPVNFILNQPYLDKLTFGAVYVKSGEEKA